MPETPTLMCFPRDHVKEVVAALAQRRYQMTKTDKRLCTLCGQDMRLCPCVYDELEKLEAQVARLREGCEAISNAGTEAPSVYDPVQYYRGELLRCAAIAKRALDA